jgi:hypothetical protein
MSIEGLMAMQALEMMVAQWQFRYPWEVVSHDASCCTTFNAWRKIMYHLEMKPGIPSLPSFIQSQWRWGPTRPIYTWCDLIKNPLAECGTLAAICQEAYLERGFTAYRVQTIERHPSSDTHHWQIAWAKAGVRSDWIQDDLVYHEMVAVQIGGLVRLWDSTSWEWIEPSNPTRTPILALRIFGPPLQMVTWDIITLPCWKWTIL